MNARAPHVFSTTYCLLTLWRNCELPLRLSYLKDLQPFLLFFFFQAEDGIRDSSVTGVQTCALPIYPHSFNQQPHGFNKVLEIQEGLAHSHEDQIHAIDRRRNLLVPQYGNHLTGNLSCAQIPLYPNQPVETELPIDDASHLTPNPDRR